MIKNTLVAAIALSLICQVFVLINSAEAQDVEAQPFKSQAQRVAQALKYLGAGLDKEQSKKLNAALKETDDNKAVAQIQSVLDQRTLIRVNINPESRVKIFPFADKPKLVEQGWSVFLVKVENQAGVTARLRVSSPNAKPVFRRSTGAASPQSTIDKNDLKNRWLDIAMFDTQPLNKKLSGLEIEYRIVQVYSRDKGKREGKISFDIGQGTQDIGFRNEVAMLFDCTPAVPVQLDVLDHDGKPTMGSFVFRDARGRVYPARAKRIAPDFFFHDQIYRKTGEKIMLPAGEYEVVFTRGPEYEIQKRKITVPTANSHREFFRLKRWIKMTDFGWYSGDHHVHAAGCSHYESPTQGVTPEDMMRHVMGEDLNVGCVLSWGPCWYYQKDFFDGKTSSLSVKNHLMRYDVEVSGFPSAHAGHLCLLNLKNDDFEYENPVEFDFRYAGERGRFKGTKTSKIAHWPSYDLPILKWGMKQGGVVGFSHSGWGLQVPGNELPNYNIPQFDGIGANEYIVDVCHDAVHFISTVDTPAVWELNIWYHTLNCGYTCRISGETDFPCIYDERVGLGRSYVKLDKSKPFEYEKWIDGIRAGRSYVSDGLSHLFDFEVNGVPVGAKGDRGRESFVAIKSGESITANVIAAAKLAKKPNESIRKRPLPQKPYWHVERARIKNTNKVPVELIVNGQSVETKEVEGDGAINKIKFDYKPERSCWVALRIFPSSHTNPVFVEVDGKPIRASRRSAQWCRKSVDVCWKSKVRNIMPHERETAKKAFDFARQKYQKIIDESFDDTKK